MHVHAQTHLQLYRELIEAGYDEAELVLCGRAYELAAELFAGHLRASGKPFLCHLVGTASILVRERAPADVIAAALVHAAHQDEVSPTGTTAILPPMQQRLRALSPAVSDLVEDYTRTTDDAAELLALTVEGEAQRWVVLMRVANGLEDLLDGAGAVASKSRFDCMAAAELSGRLEAPTLQQLARELSAPEASLELPAALRTGRVRSRAVHTPLGLRGRRALHATAARLRARLKL